MRFTSFVFMRLTWPIHRSALILFTNYFREMTGVGTMLLFLRVTLLPIPRLKSVVVEGSISNNQNGHFSHFILFWLGLRCLFFT